MKHFFFLIAIISTLLVLGCQDSSITDPVSSGGMLKDQSAGGTITQGTIPLEGILEVQGMNNVYYSIYGSIDYVHELVLVDPIPPAPQYHIELEMTINASFTTPDFPSEINLTVSGESLDIFYVSEEGIYMLEKIFPVDAVNNGLSLVCSFLVTTNGVGLNEMWLTINNDIKNN